MRSTRRARLLTLWIACLAVLLGTLTPVGSRAMGSWAEMCTANGARWVRTSDPTSDPAPSEAAHLLGHCPLCGLHLPTLAPPPAHAGTLPQTASGFAVPQLLLAAPRTLFAWPSAQARAPPLPC